MTKLNKFAILAAVLIGLVCAGCLVSGTFVIVEDVNFDFTADTGYYWFPIDLRGNPDWKEHKDDIDDIDAIGLYFTLVSTSDEDCWFTVYFEATTTEADPFNPPTPNISNFVLVFERLEIAAGETRVVKYDESLGIIQNVDAIKKIVKTGRFDYWGLSCGGTDDDDFVVTDGKIVVTVSGSKS